MFKFIICGALLILSLVFLKLGLLSFVDAAIVFENFDFSNIFFPSNWLIFRKIFTVYSACSFLLGVLVWYKFILITKYISRDKNQFKAFAAKFIEEIKQNKSLYITAFIALSLGVLLRGYKLNRPIRYDESFTFLEYGKSYIGYVSMNYSYPNNHILHSILVRISTVILGNNLWAIRLPAFLGGIMVLIFTFLIGRKWFGLKAGILALLLVSCSEWLIEYSVNARGYSLQTALLLLVVFLVLDHKKPTGRWLIVSIINALGFWLIPSYVFHLAVLFLIIVIKNGFPFKLTPFFLLTILLATLFYLPVLAYSGIDALFNNAVTQTYNSLTYLQDFYINISSIYINLTPTQGILQLIIFLIFIASSFLKKTKWFSIGIVVLLSFMILTLGNKTPARVFVFLIPIAVILISGAFSNKLNKLKPPLFFILLFIPLISWSIYKNKRFDYEIALNDLPELIDDLKSVNAVGVLSKIPVDYPVRYYLSKNNNLQSRWNSVGSDTIYVITNSFYNQDLKNDFGEKTKGYSLSPLKKYKYSTLHLGIKQQQNQGNEH